MHFTDIRTRSGCNTSQFCTIGGIRLFNLAKILQWEKQSSKVWLAGVWVERSGSRGLGSRPGLAIVLCSWAKHFTRTMPLSTWECKWVPANFQENMIGNAGGGGVTCNGIASHLTELAVILVDKHKHRLCLFVNSYNIT